MGINWKLDDASTQEKDEMRKLRLQKIKLQITHLCQLSC